MRAGSMSTQRTSLPAAAKQAPVTRPTYPVPKMVMCTSRNPSWSRERWIAPEWRGATNGELYDVGGGPWIEKRPTAGHRRPNYAGTGPGTTSVRAWLLLALTLRGREQGPGFDRFCRQEST